MGSVASGVGSSPSDSSSSFCLWSLPEVNLLASSCTTQFQHYGTLETPLPLGALGLSAFNQSLGTSGNLCLSSFCISSSSSVQVSGRTCQRSTQTFDSGGTMLDGGSLASHISQHVDRGSSALSHHKRSHHGYFGRPHAQGSPYPLAVLRCVLHRQGFPTSVCQTVLGAT